ncbi:carboxymuconolactone decarboxylase family protein [Sphingomonas sp. DT-204]|uniref:carboxymuconolactone decarboxylase family protein n=1 Tax=Sphingomonas sp. DT-204 TaxID=3396166 RepID=UPI003F197CB4
MQSEQDRAAFKARYIALRGYWAEFNEGLLAHSPEWLEAYLDYSSCPALTGPLSPRLRELIYVAVDASTTHLFEAGLEVHVALALEVGCSAGELIEVLQLATLQGLDSVSVGMRILAEEMSGASGEAAPARAAEALARWPGEQPDWLPLMASLAPAWVEALGNLLATSDRTSRLSDIERTLIRLALAVSPTHLHQDGIRLETRRALAGGASAAEIAQVFQLVAHLGLHACSEGIPTILRVAAKP